MAYSKSIADRIRSIVVHRRGITEKKMFGGVGFLLNGNMLFGVWKTSMIARIGLANYDDAMHESHVREFDITGKTDERLGVRLDDDGQEAQVGT